MSKQFNNLLMAASNSPLPVTTGVATRQIRCFLALQESPPKIGPRSVQQFLLDEGTEARNI